MAELAVVNTSLTGATPAYVAASAGGDTFDNSGKEVLRVKNASAAAITVTVDSVAKCSQGFDHDAGGSVPAGGERLFGPFPVGRFGLSPSITYTAVTSVTVAVERAA